MKTKDVRDLGAEELRQKERELRDEIFRLKMKRAASSLENKMLIRNRRRDLARVVTFLQAKTEGKAN
ncbi:MAG TPA: 50S ribosomal protein L29 [Patescibacteria group bacterium]|nr:50S ribosomal protein L29 [Patescibacteria group bacterium]HLO09051.1 50S ribosomal protein L29 [Desulfobacteria bacterium]